MKKNLYLVLLATACLFFTTRSFADVTYSTQTLAAGNAGQGSTDNILYIVKVDVTDLPVMPNSIQFTLIGTQDANDLTNLRIYTNTTASLSGATFRNAVSPTFAAPHFYNAGIFPFSIAANSTLYFIITVDISPTGTAGNTVKIDGAANPVTFTYTTAPTIINNQTDAAGTKTIQDAGVNYSSEPVAAANIAQGSTNNIIYIAKVDVTDLPVTTNAIQFTLTGTHDVNDLTNVRIYTNTTASLSGATVRNTVSGTFAAPHFYNATVGTVNIAAGTTLYFIIVVDVHVTGTGGNTIKIDGAVNPVTFTYSTAPTITNNQTDAAGAKTIQAATVTYSSEALPAANVAQGSTNNIVYIVKVDVTDLLVTTSAIQVTLSGTHDANDLTNIKIYTNSTPSLSGATSRGSFGAGFAAPHFYNLPYSGINLAAGSTIYFIVAVDISASGTGGNTIKVDGAANPVTFTYSTAPTITNNQTDVAGAKTIQAATVTYSSEALPAANVAQGSTNNIVYIAKVDVTVLPVTTSAIQVTLSGTHDANDLTNIKIYTNSTPSLTGAISRGSFGAGFAAPHFYNLPYSGINLAAGSTIYFIVAVDINASGTGGNTIKVDGAANPVTFTYTTSPTITNNQTDVAGVKTIQAAGVTYSSEAVPAANVAQGSTNNIVYMAKVDVTDLPVTTSAIQVTLSGTHDANDLTNIKIYTNSTPSLSGATNRGSFASGFAAPHFYNLPYSGINLAAGSTIYFIVAVDISASGTGGNTIKVDGAANPVTFTYGTAPTITNNQTDVAGVKTIQAAGVTYSSEALPAANVAQGSTNNIVYMAKVDVTDLPVTTSAIQVTLSGTHDANDLSNIKIYTNSTPSLTGATNRGSFASGFAAPHSYNLSYSSINLAAGSTIYFIVMVDISASGTGGNTIKVDGAANPVTFTYGTAPAITNNQTDVAGVKTIQAAGVTYSSEALPAANVAQGSTNNIVYMAKVDVTDLPVTTSAIQVTLSGTHDANDLTNIKIYTNSTPSLTGAISRGSFGAGFAAPHLYNLPYSSINLAAGSTIYFIVAVDISASGTGGNTIKVDGAANPVTFTYGTAPPVTNNQTDAAGAKTIQAAGITLSSETIASSAIIPGSSNNIIYITKMDVTILPVDVTNIQFTLSGTHDADDLTNLKIYSNTTATLSGATNLGSFAATFAAPHVYNLNISDVAIAAGVNRYFIIVADLHAVATITNTVKLDGSVNPVTFSFATSPSITNNQTDAAGVKTISSTLPLTLLGFTGSVINTHQYVQLRWVTSGEVNTKEFDVEWSTDGIQFSKTAVIQAAGISTQHKEYNYIHRMPAGGNNYYRLKMKDIDGRFTYSPVITVKISITTSRISAYPNPVVDQLNIWVEAVKNETLVFDLYNVEGKIIASRSVVLIKGTNQFSWNMQQLPAGHYFVSNRDRSFETIKIIKQ